MNHLPPHKKSSTDIIRVIALLNDIREALQNKSLLEEAQLVSQHLKRLDSPQTRTRIAQVGIDSVLEEMAGEFFTHKTPDS